MKQEIKAKILERARECFPEEIVLELEKSLDSHADIEHPFVVPPFDAGKHKIRDTFFWWSWHPNYPYWSKSCWGGKTFEEGYNQIYNPHACDLLVYHNKLIQEKDGKFIEVADFPCQEPEVWDRIEKQRIANNYYDSHSEEKCYRRNGR